MISTRRRFHPAIRALAVLLTALIGLAGSAGAARAADDGSGSDSGSGSDGGNTNTAFGIGVAVVVVGVLVWLGVRSDIARSRAEQARPDRIPIALRHTRRPVYLEFNAPVETARPEDRTREPAPSSMVGAVGLRFYF